MRNGKIQHYENYNKNYDKNYDDESSYDDSYDDENDDDSIINKFSILKNRNKFFHSFNSYVNEIITAKCGVCRRIKKSVWLCHPVFTFLVCSECYLKTCSRGEHELSLPRALVQNSCSICKIDLFHKTSGNQLFGFIECNRCILRFCYNCFNIILSINNAKILKPKLNSWVCFRCYPGTMHIMLKEADTILNCQLKIFMSKLRKYKTKKFTEETCYDSENYNIQSGLLLLKSNVIDKRNI